MIDSTKLEAPSDEPSIWDDVEPISCPQNPDGVFGIKYSPNYRTEMGRFRYVLEHHEISPRALELTTCLCKRYYSNPTLWSYRRELISKLGYNFQDEIQIINSIFFSRNPKPYQPWTHRQWLVDREKTDPDETDFFQRIIDEDERNFHAWAYFIWYAQRWNQGVWLFNKTTNVISFNPYNASAWSTRMAALKIANIQPVSDLPYVFEQLIIKPDSESTINYFRGLYFQDHSLGPKICEQISSILAKYPSNYKILMLKATIDETERNTQAYEKTIQEIAQIDTMRAKFWAKIQNHDPIFEDP